MGASFLAGLLSFLSPCVLPLIPAYLSYISGLSLEQLTQDSNISARRLAVLHTLAFIAGFSVIFIALGATASALGQEVVRFQAAIRVVGGLILVLFGLFLMGIVRLPLLQKSLMAQLEHKPAGYFGAFLIGAGFATGWTPCVGPILASILFLAATQETVLSGVFLLGVYCIGLGVPFLLAAWATSSFVTLFKRLKRFLQWSERLAGFLLIGMGLLLISGQMLRLTAKMLQIFEPWARWLTARGL